MMKSMRQKLETLNERNEMLKQELRIEEAKTQSKTLSLEAAVGQLRAELKCWGAGSPTSPTSLPGFRRASNVSEVWSGRTSESSSGSRGSQASHGSHGSGARLRVRKASRRPTTTFRPLQQLVAAEKAVTEHDGPAEATEAANPTMPSLHSLRSSVSGLMDDALLRVGELLQDAGEEPRVSKTGREPSELPQDGSSPEPSGLSDMWKASSRESASAALAHFGALLQQQVSSAAELAATAMPSVSSRT